MRNAALIFAVICGAIVVYTVGVYGFLSSDDPAVKWNMAFLYGAIACGGLFGHAFSVAVYRVSKLAGAITGIVVIAAMMLNLSNSLGALAGKESKTTAESTSKLTQVRDDRAELARLQKALDAIGTFVPTDEAAVTAATAATTAATNRRIAECGIANEKRGPDCKKREADEATAATSRATTAAAKSATDRATRLEAQMQPIRERLLKAGPIAATNVQGNALAKLFRLPDTEAGFMAVLQQFGLAAVVEGLIVMAMVGWELTKPPKPVRKPEPVEPVLEPVKPVIAPDAPNLPVQTRPVLALERPRPKLAAATRQPVGAVLDFLHDAVTIDAGRVEMVDLFMAYQTWCKAHNLRTIDVADFATEIEEFGLRIDGDYVLDMQLKPMRVGSAV